MIRMAKSRRANARGIAAAREEIRKRELTMVMRGMGNAHRTTGIERVRGCPLSVVRSPLPWAEGRTTDNRHRRTRWRKSDTSRFPAIITTYWKKRRCTRSGSSWSSSSKAPPALLWTRSAPLVRGECCARRRSPSTRHVELGPALARMRRDRAAHPTKSPQARYREPCRTHQPTSQPRDITRLTATMAK